MLKNVNYNLDGFDHDTDQVTDQDMGIEHKKDKLGGNAELSLGQDKPVYPSFCFPIWPKKEKPVTNPSIPVQNRKNLSENRYHPTDIYVILFME